MVLILYSVFGDYPYFQYLWSPTPQSRQISMVKDINANLLSWNRLADFASTMLNSMVLSNHFEFVWAVRNQKFSGFLYSLTSTGNKMEQWEVYNTHQRKLRHCFSIHIWNIFWVQNSATNTGVCKSLHLYEETVYSCIINYCMISQTNNYKPTFAHLCIVVAIHLVTWILFSNRSN